MTLQSLYDTIEALIEAEYKRLDAATRANYLASRKKIADETAKLWAQSAVDPKLNPQIGNIVYVSKQEAVRYGRLEKLDETIKGVSKAGQIIDISNIEIHGKRIYELQYNGAAWVYQQGAGLPVTGGARIKLVASALYSDFYGNPFPELVKMNWNGYYDSIVGAINRGLNQGASYSKMARTIAGETDMAYKKTLLIAATEAHRIQSQSYLDSLALLDEVDAEYGKMWISSIDDKTRASHIIMDGKFADAKGIFHLSGGSGPAPGKIGVASEDINCRCRAVTIFDGQRPKERRVRGEGIVSYETFEERLSRGGSVPMRDVRKAKQA